MCTVRTCEETDCRLALNRPLIEKQAQGGAMIAFAHQYGVFPDLET